MKKLILSFVALALSATAFSQAQVDLNLSLKMKEVTSVKKTYAKSPLLKERICVAADVQEWAIPEINRFAKVQAYSGGIALIDLNVSDLEQLCNTKGVKFVNSPGTAHLCMDKAREKGNIDRVHKGEDLPQGYDGTGVTVGIVDAGIDPNHAAFTDAQGNSRVKSFLVYDSIKGEYCPATTPEEIKKIKTDLPTTFHGTHTSSIAAGRELGNGYGGVAPGADIIMGAANADPNPKYEKLTTADRVLLTLALTTEYAKIYDTPRVFNLSAGYNLGAHDGTDPYSRFVGGLAKDNIICISAGNEGFSDVAANHTFKQNENAYLLMPFGSNNVQLWSDTDKPFKGEVSLVNNYTGEIVKFFSVDDVSEVKVIDNNDTSEAGKYLKWLVSPKEALLAVSSSVRAQNNRYCLELVYNIPEIEDTQLHYRILVKVSGEEGQKVSAYEENSSLKFEDVKNLYDDKILTDGVGMKRTTNGSISTFCLNDDAISVGACVSRVEDIFQFEFEDCVCLFSSWCDYPGSYKRPHLLAPGAHLHAACNRYAAVDPTVLEYVEYNSEKYPYVSNQGTSMASPFVAGTIALWLQANPELKPQDVLNIIEKTCVKNEYYMDLEDKAQWGAGIIDAYAGIKEALSMPTSIVEIGASKAIPLVKLLADKTLEITVSAGNPCNVKIYSLDGKVVKTAASRDNNIIIPLPSLTGAYIVNVNGKTMKIMI